MSTDHFGTFARTTTASKAVTPAVGDVTVRGLRKDFEARLQLRLAAAVARTDPSYPQPLLRAKAAVPGILGAVFALIADLDEEFDDEILRLADDGIRARDDLASTFEEVARDVGEVVSFSRPV